MAIRYESPTPLTLQRWLLRYFVAPLLVVALIVVALAWVHLWNTWRAGRDFQVRSIEQAASLISVAIPQKNRALLETSLDTIRWTVESPSAALCVEGNVVLQTGTVLQDCTTDPSIEYVRLTKDLPGFEGHALSVLAPRVSKGSEFWFVCLITACLLIFFLGLAIRIRGQLMRDVINPLMNGLIDGDSLKILELQALQNAQRQAVQLKLVACS